MTEEQFWDLTLAQFYALKKRREAETKHDDYRFGVIASNIANAHFKPPAGLKTFTPGYFFPMLREAEKKRSSPRMKPAAMLRLMQMLFPPNKEK